MSIYVAQTSLLIFILLSFVSSLNHFKNQQAKQESQEDQSPTKDAMEFAKNYHRRKFNQIESDLCQVFKLLSASLENDRLKDDSEKVELINTKTNTQSSQQATQNFSLINQEHGEQKHPDILFDSEKMQSNCPICLESLTDIFEQRANSPPNLQGQSTLSNNQQKIDHHKLNKMISEKLRGGADDYTLTILCCHNFHQMCLRNWNDTTCPLCRYIQSPVESSQCDQCSATENLWVCLICGFIGCFKLAAFTNSSRAEGDRLLYDSDQYNSEDYLVLQSFGHSHEHYEDSKHTYAMEIETHNVWDFYGKLVEFGDPTLTESLLQTQRSNEFENSSSDGTISNNRQNQQRHFNSEKDFTVDSVHRYNKKIESLNYEYNHMLAQTLENQRTYFEQRLGELNREEDYQIESKKHEITDIENKLIKIDASIENLNTSLDQEKLHFDSIKETYAIDLKDLLTIEIENKRLREESELQSNQIDIEIKKLQEELKQLDQEVNEARQDKQDLINHMKMTEKVKKSKNQHEIMQGQTLIFETGQNSSAGKGGRKNKRNK
ncbi:brca1-associated protein [Stylonychia lemnae]|uniref:Brca1-associated protein n=1 Tax=Stylonychia lemnae TaxID=5949 RepID=A0A078AR48_STYLE|nr:brca1-associated protein [Stylonychia lemnae]|eukprot:CDW84875.1 brca1-associated protein [Stylonychia lemnae]